MSDQYVLSRRKAIALFGMSVAGIAAEGAQSNPAPAHAGSGELESVGGSARPQYIFGYGSLVQRQSRVETCPGAEFAFPVIVHGVSRGWSTRPAEQVGTRPISARTCRKTRYATV
jgi:hypothetical protein